jgi:hypothetical protein
MKWISKSYHNLLFKEQPHINLWYKAFLAVVLLHLTLFLFGSEYSFVGATKNLSADPIVCPPYFKNCLEYTFLDILPESWERAIFSTCLFSLLFFAFYTFLNKLWKTCHFTILLLFIWKILHTWVLSFNITIEYSFFSDPFIFIFLFCNQQLWLSRIVLSLLYIFAAKVKLTSTWIAGTYFSATQMGLPLFAESLIPFLTNYVILLEIFAALGLLSKSVILRKASVALLIIFHLYSIPIIGYAFAGYVLPLLLINYLLPKEYYLHESNKKLNYPSITLLCILIVCGFVQNLIPGDERYTQEGRGFGSAMIDANHQCLIEFEIIYKNGKIENGQHYSSAAGVRCWPYKHWFLAQEKCKKSNVEKVALTMYQSINGGPLYLSVDESNICNKKYHFLAKNDWIKEPNANSKILGYPFRNAYRWHTHDIEKPYSEKPIIKLSALQEWILQNLKAFKLVYGVVWAIVFLAILSRIRIRPLTRIE